MVFLEDFMQRNDIAVLAADWAFSQVCNGVSIIDLNGAICVNYYFMHKGIYLLNPVVLDLVDKDLFSNAIDLANEHV